MHLHLFTASACSGGNVQAVNAVPVEADDSSIKVTALAVACAVLALLCVIALFCVCKQKER